MWACQLHAPHTPRTEVYVDSLLCNKNHSSEKDLDQGGAEVSACCVSTKPVIITPISDGSMLIRMKVKFL